MNKIKNTIFVLLFVTGITFLNSCVKGDFDTPPVPSFLFYETFKDTLGSFTQYSVTGSQMWVPAVHNETTYAYMTGYFDGTYNANEDWLISKPINFDNYTGEALSFESAMDYGTAGDGSLKVYTSTDYLGTGDPNLATWIEIIPVTLSTGDFLWVSSGSIDLSAITGTNVYVAFKYLCTTSGVPSWELTKTKLTGILK